MEAKSKRAQLGGGKINWFEHKKRKEKKRKL
jgi:hypothetical protein